MANPPSLKEMLLTVEVRIGGRIYYTTLPVSRIEDLLYFPKGLVMY